jgi:hypothetical protein
MRSLENLCWRRADKTGSGSNGRVETSGSINTQMGSDFICLWRQSHDLYVVPNVVALMCEHPVLRVGLIRNTRHYMRVRRQTIQLIMWCNVFIISFLPFPSLDKLSNLTSQPYFRFREAQNLKIDHSYCLQVKRLSNVLSSRPLFIDDATYSDVFSLLLFKNYSFSSFYPSISYPLTIFNQNWIITEHHTNIKSLKSIPIVYVSIFGIRSTNVTVSWRCEMGKKLSPHNVYCIPFDTWWCNGLSKNMHFILWKFSGENLRVKIVFL